MKTLQAYGERGVPVHAITLQNEPLHNPSTYPGLLMNSSEQLAFINDHLAPALDAAAVQYGVLCSTVLCCV